MKALLLNNSLLQINKMKKFIPVIYTKSFLLLALLAFTVSSIAQTVEKKLYLTDPAQGLDRIDPVAAGDGTTSTTSALHDIIRGSIADQINSVSYNGNNSVGPLYWTTDWIETDLAGGGATTGNIRMAEFPLGSGNYEIAFF